MIQVLLLILKIIGITLLVVLGLVLLVLALVLFVPVCYRVRVIHNSEQTKVTGRVSFLFPLLSATFQYLEKFSYRARLLFLVLIDSEKSKKEKKAKKEKRKKKKKQRKQTEEQLPTELPEKTIESEEPEESIESTQTIEPTSSAENVNSTGKEEPEQKSEASAQKKKTGIFEKIRLKIQKIRETISNIIKKLKKLLHQKDEVLRILNKPSSKEAMAFAWGKLKALLKHILPGKIKGYVAYGADNPATTGQVLGVLGVIYAKTGQLVEIRPNFQEKQLECDVELRGRVQLFTLIVIAVKVLMKQELRGLISDFKNVKNIE